jgi:hypothetical protein
VTIGRRTRSVPRSSERQYHDRHADRKSSRAPADTTRLSPTPHRFSRESGWAWPGSSVSSSRSWQARTRPPRRRGRLVP